MHGLIFGKKKKDFFWWMSRIWQRRGVTVWTTPIDIKTQAGGFRGIRRLFS